MFLYSLYFATIQSANKRFSIHSATLLIPVIISKQQSLNIVSYFKEAHHKSQQQYCDYYCLFGQ